MEKLNKFVKSRTTAYYLLLAATFLELIFAILYPLFFGEKRRCAAAIKPCRKADKCGAQSQPVGSLEPEA